MTANKHSPKIVAILSALALALCTAQAGAATFQELQQRFEKRYPQVQSLKSAGKIGETFHGYVEPVRGGLDADQSKLVNEENADRRELYQAIANKEKISPDVVARRNAARNFEKARKGEYLRNEKGEWTQK